MSTRKLVLALLVTALGPSGALLACSSSSNGSSTQGGHDSGTSTETGAPSCVAHPQTAVDILNACTDAASVDKHPVLPLLLPDGGLPPLP